MSFDRTMDGWSEGHDGAELTACGETMAVIRKKALLRILARHDAHRVGIEVTDADLQATSDLFRRSFGLVEDEDFSCWIECQGLTKFTFARAMHDFTVVRLLEEAYAAEIDQLAPDQIAISTARYRSSA